MKIIPLASTARDLPRSPRPPHRGRRGALLLLVLGMLTLFMMIGTLMLVLAMRARSTSRAFADAVAGSGNRAAAARGLLDEALMRLLRGTLPPAGTDPPDYESLLADRYGTETDSGTLTAITAAGSVLAATVTGIDGDSLDLAGRILTITPQASDSAPVTSFRILSVNGQTFTLANLRTVAVRPLPAAAALPCDVFVNGREFAGTTVPPPDDKHESWDAFDARNPFLTQVSADGTVSRPAYGALPAVVDNDGDGVADGIWLDDDFLPEQPDGSEVRVSLLVLDLGGRLNVNAHGGDDGTEVPGPALVEGGPVLESEDAWDDLLDGGDSPATPAEAEEAAAATGNRRPAPALGSGLQGRFGGIEVANRDTYALRLDFDGPRTASRAAAANVANLFTCGELERVLRPFDRDTAALPPRLAALLGDDAEPRRMLVTTDSWDTCGMVGLAARNVADNGNPATLPDDAKEGYRFNLRSLSGATAAAKQQFFSELLAVVKAAGAPDDGTTDQWVANVVDFIDDDDTAGTYGGRTGVEPTTLNGEGLPASLPVQNPGSFASAAVLLAVPTGTKAEIEAKAPPLPAPPLPITSLAVTHPEILDAVTVESRFDTTVFVTSGTPPRRLCRWREPGRINVNTCDKSLWDALTGQSFANPFSGGTPAETLSDVLLGVPEVFNVALAGDPGTPEFSRDVRKWNGTLANRLANIATTRSDVFAVWITLELKQSSDSSPEYHRLFAIVDRSIPVGHAAGQDLNVRDTIRVLRHLE